MLFAYTIEVSFPNYAVTESRTVKKYFKKFLPSQEAVKQNRWILPFGAWLHHPNLWHLHRRSVAGGAAVGLFCGLIPGPFQMMGAIVFAVLFRVNLPVALATTFYTNPLTIAPLYFLAYKLGVLVTGQNHGSANHFTIPQIGWSDWYTVLPQWIFSLGKPFAIGLPLLATLLAVAGYFLVRILWRGMVVWKWRKRAQGRGKIL